MEQAAVVHFEGDKIHLPSSALSHAGFREWVKSDDFPEEVRASYVGGEVFLEMSPESIDTHNKVKLEVAAMLLRLVEESDLGEIYTDRALLTNEAAQLSTEPDAIFVTWDTLESGRVTGVPKKNRDDDVIELVGTPDLVIEVVSDSSVRKDLVALRERYARAGIPEYWIIDARSAVVRFAILVLADGAYEPAADEGRPQPSRVFARTFQLERAKNRIGTWRYALRVS